MQEKKIQRQTCVVTLWDVMVYVVTLWDVMVYVVTLWDVMVYVALKISYQ